MELGKKHKVIPFLLETEFPYESEISLLGSGMLRCGDRVQFVTMFPVQRLAPNTTVELC